MTRLEKRYREQQAMSETDLKCVVRKVSKEDLCQIRIRGPDGETYLLKAEKDTFIRQVYYDIEMLEIYKDFEL